MASNQEFERIKQAIAADPSNVDAATQQAIAGNDELRQYQEEMQALDTAILECSKVEIPAGLADKLLAIPGAEASSESKEAQSSAAENVVKLPGRKAHFIQLAMAASIAFAVGLSFTFFNQNADIRSGADLAMAHMFHEQEYTQRVARDVTLEEVNTKLATFGGEMLQTVGKITYANFCFFESQKSLHMVMHTENGDITLFVTPEDFEKQIDSRFQEDGFEGRSWRMQKADVTIIGEKGKLDDNLERSIRQSMQFSA